MLHSTTQLRKKIGITVNLSMLKGRKVPFETFLLDLTKLPYFAS
jgi:hypothetical protein